MKKQYIAIDLKSFYASVECRERNLDPLTTNLVVADASRTDKTICLAVSPSLKELGISGRPRLFEVVQRMKEINRTKEKKHSAFDKNVLMQHPDWTIDYIVAPPRMALYMNYSTTIYQTYLKYVSSEDIHVYSIDEVFIDATPYLDMYNQSAHDLAMTMIRDVLKTTGITATAGIGTNLYLAKVAMDIMAKKMRPDQDGVRIAQLDEISYRKQLWEHTPLTDFWRIGSGISRRLKRYQIYTMGDIAQMSMSEMGEDLLYKLFGINAELIIDHAWGWEPCTIQEIKAYKPSTTSLSSGQVLSRPYSYQEAKIVTMEMMSQLSYDLIEKGLVTNQMVLNIGYDIENLRDPKIREQYKGEVHYDYYGRAVPKHSHGTQNMEYTSVRSLLETNITSLFDRIIDKNLLIRRITISVNHLAKESTIKKPSFEQLDLFTDPIQKEKEKIQLKKERQLQEAILNIRNQYGKNAILYGLNFEKGATAKERNLQIGGHRA